MYWKSQRFVVGHSTTKWGQFWFDMQMTIWFAKTPS